MPVAPDLTRPAPPTADKRWKLVEATMRRMGNNPRGLIESLHTVQEVFGYLDVGALRFVARSLRVPLSRAYGVPPSITFSRSSRRASTLASSASEPLAISKVRPSCWRR